MSTRYWSSWETNAQETALSFKPMTLWLHFLSLSLSFSLSLSLRGSLAQTLLTEKVCWQEKVCVYVCDNPYIERLSLQVFAT